MFYVRTFYVRTFCLKLVCPGTLLGMYDAMAPACCSRSARRGGRALAARAPAACNIAHAMACVIDTRLGGRAREASGSSTSRHHGCSTAVTAGATACAVMRSQDLDVGKPYAVPRSSCSCSMFYVLCACGALCRSARCGSGSVHAHAHGSGSRVGLRVAPRRPLDAGAGVPPG